LSSDGKTVEIKCPKCKDILRIKVDAATLANAVSPPISVTYIHGDPKYSVHSTTIWVDKNYDIRAVEASDSTILGRGMEAGGASPSVAQEGRELGSLLPDEVEVTDRAIGKLKDFLEGAGRLSAQMAREFTDAYDQFSRLSEIIERKKTEAKHVTTNVATTEKPQVATRVAKKGRRRKARRKLRIIRKYDE